MGNIVLLLVLLPLAAMMIFVVNLSYANPYDPYAPIPSLPKSTDDEFDNSLQQFNSIQDPDYVYEINDGDINHNELILKQNPEKRACIRRAGNCDHRQNDCCYSSSCRCNLWGSNCRCQRMGLFQKWG